MSKLRWTKEHGADGLRDKFSVYKTKDRQRSVILGDHVYRAQDRLPDDEFVFTMRPETDAEAWRALHLYADVVEHRQPKLAEDIRTELDRIETNNAPRYLGENNVS